MPTNADVVSLQMEKVSKKLSEVFETSSWLFSKVSKSADVEKVSTRDFRKPIIVSHGGNYRKYDPDGGDKGRGTGPKAAHFVSTYFPTLYAIELTDLQMMATAESEQAVKKAFALTVGNAMDNFKAMEDATLHTGGDGVFAIAVSQATDTGKTVYTLDTTLGTQLCRRQQKAAVYSNDLGTLRAAGPFSIDKVDRVSNKVTMSATIGSAANDDKLVFEGVSATPPVWKNGIYAFNSTATTGNLLSLSRTDYPEIISNFINANGASLTGVHAMLLLDQIEQNRNDLGDLTFILHPKQRTAYYKSIQDLSFWMRGKSDSPIDIVPKRVQEFQFAGIQAVTDKHALRNRVDALALKKFGRAELAPLDWYRLPDGTKTFPLYGASGGLGSGILMYLTLHSDYVHSDPGSQGFVYNLEIPTA